MVNYYYYYYYYYYHHHITLYCSQVSEYPGKSKPQTISDRNVKSQRILTELHALDSKYISERTTESR